MRNKTRVVKFTAFLVLLSLTVSGFSGLLAHNNSSSQLPSMVNQSFAFWNPPTVTMNYYGVKGYLYDHLGHAVSNVKIEIYEVQGSKDYYLSSVYTSSTGYFYYKLSTYDSESTKTFKLKVYYSSAWDHQSNKVFNQLTGVTKNTIQQVTMRYGYYVFDGKTYRTDGKTAYPGATVKIYKVYNGDMLSLIGQTSSNSLGNFHYVFETLEAASSLDFKVKALAQMPYSDTVIYLSGETDVFTIDNGGTRLSVDLVLSYPSNVFQYKFVRNVRGGFTYVREDGTINYDVPVITSTSVFSYYYTYSPSVSFPVTIITSLSVTIESLTLSSDYSITARLKISTFYITIVPDAWADTVYAKYVGLLATNIIHAYSPEDDHNKFEWDDNYDNPNHPSHYELPSITKPFKELHPILSFATSEIVGLLIGAAIGAAFPEAGLLGTIAGDALTEVIMTEFITDKLYTGNFDNGGEAYMKRINAYASWQEPLVLKQSGEIDHGVVNSFLSVDYADWKFSNYGDGSYHELRLDLENFVFKSTLDTNPVDSFNGLPIYLRIAADPNFFDY